MASSLYVAIRGDYSQFKKDLEAVRSIAKKNGEDISNALNNAISPHQATKALSGLTTSLKNAQAVLSSKNALLPSIQGLKDLARSAGVSTAEMEKLSQSMMNAARKSNLSRAFEDIQRQAGLSNLAMARLRMRMGDLRDGVQQLLPSFNKLLAMGAGLAAFAKSVVETQMAVDSLGKAFSTITGSGAAGQEQLDFIRKTSDELGLEFLSTAEAAKTFYAAAKGSSLSGDANTIFKAFSEAGTALSLSKDQMQGVFLALGQMISKGKVQAEELRGQIGERLPGAFQLAAKAMGMTTAELDKFMADGKLTGGFVGLDYAVIRMLAQDFGIETPPAFWRKARSVEEVMLRLAREEMGKGQS